MKKVIRILVSALLGLALIFGVITLLNEQNAKNMESYIDSFGAVEFDNQLMPQYDENGAAYFVTDGEFKVMHLTDVHLGGSFISTKDDKKAMNAVAAMIATEQPDLVVVTGDISFAVPWAATLNNKYAHDMFIRFMENLGVYWTVTFGNHDSELYNYYTRSDVAGFYENESLKYCLFDRGPDDIFGECNHAITVRNSAGLITEGIIMIDSNSYTDEDIFGFKWVYDNIHQDQIDWYKETIESHNAHNKSINPDIDTTVESLVFMHIPIMEVRDANHEYINAGNKDTDDVKHLFGEIGEKDPYVYCSEEAEEMFETMVELGSTEAIFYGHDHVNNILLEYKGIKLCYGYSVDYFAYWQIAKQGAQRGCTIINCHPDTTFEIIHENYYQDKYVPLYEKEVVDITK